MEVALRNAGFTAIQLPEQGAVFSNLAAQAV